MGNYIVEVFRKPLYLSQTSLTAFLRVSGDKLRGLFIRRLLASLVFPAVIGNTVIPVLRIFKPVNACHLYTSLPVDTIG